MVASGEVAARVAAVRERIAAACERVGRPSDAVRLVGVTKKVAPDLIPAAFGAGLRELAENHVQELRARRDLAPEATWHLIGPLQANKAGKAVEVADVIQTLEPGRAADRLARLAAAGRRIRALVQVDFTGRRAGVGPEEAVPFVRTLLEAGIEVEGLMTIAPLGGDPRSVFARLRSLRDDAAGEHPSVRELSMGMSADLETAVEEGATIVRVGSSIFGPRP